MAILGRAERISAANHSAISSRVPFGSRLGAWVSQPRATVIGSRSILEALNWKP